MIYRWNNSASGGAAGPVAFALLVAGMEASGAAKVSLSSKELVDAMGTVQGFLSTALTNVDSKYKTYESYYNQYIDAMAVHNLVRFISDHQTSAVYTASQLDDAVNTNTPRLYDGYYHEGTQSPSGGGHSIRRKQKYQHWSEKPSSIVHDWNTWDLEKKYKCKGPCTEKFASAYDALNSHRTECPEKHGPDGQTGVKMWSCGYCSDSFEHWRVCGGTCGKKFAPKRINHGRGGYSWVENSPHYKECTEKVSSWNPLATCGEKYFTCKHKECPKSNNHKNGSSSSNKSASLSGSSSASAGGSISLSLTTSTAFSSVYWYVAGPSDSGLGTNVETDSGGSSSTSASLSYTFGSSDSGDYTITAYIYNYSDSSVYQTSHTVSVSGSSSYTPPSYTPSTPSTPSPPSTPSSSDDSCSSDCWYEDDECNVTCTKCGASYRICTSQWGDCAEGDEYHYSDYSWQ